MKILFMDNHKHALIEAQKRAEENQKCKRKAVGCAIQIQDGNNCVITIFSANGPAKGHNCSNVVGNCGCAHAEPRAIMAALRQRWDACTLICKYSPCTNCANIIVDSQIVKKVVWEIDTGHDMRGIEILRNSKIELEIINQDKLELEKV